MTRSIVSFALSLPLLFTAGCAPAPVGPRPPGPDSDATPIADAGSIADAGVSSAADSGERREKLPAPEAGVDAATGDARIDAGAIDAARDAVVDAARDAVVDAARDAVVDVTVDAGVDVTVDAGAADTASVDAAPGRPPAAGEVVITEALVNPAGSDTGREWIEIGSRASEPLDLSGLHIADANAVDVAAPAGIIAPGARLVLGQSADATKNGGAPIAIAYGTRLGMNNDGEEISLCIGACAAGLVVDHVAWGALAAAYDGHAMVFDRDGGTTCPATQPFGTAGDFGTPGAPDDACPAPDAGF
jgi:hypothetical protein